MDNYYKEALEIVKAQASVRTMSAEEIVNMVKQLVEGIKGAVEGNVPVFSEEGVALDTKKLIKERSVTCAECGKSFKIITKRHLALHGLTPEEYRAKYGYKENTPLVCKALQRERRNKMKDMRLWERRK